MEDFRFEHTMQMTEAVFVRIESSLAHDQSARWGRRLGMGIAAVVLLAWSYTMLLGIAILVLLTISIVAPRYFPSAVAQEYRHSPYLKGPLTYGVSPKRFWVRGVKFQAEAEWSHLAFWHVKDDWLVLTGSGMPRVVLPIEALQADGLYEQVIALANQHGKEFASPKGKRVAV